MSQWEMILLAVGFAFGMGFAGIACSVKQIYDNEVEARKEYEKRKALNVGR